MNTKRALFLALITTVVSAASASAQAGTSVSQSPQTLGITVSAIDDVTASGSPSITLSAAGSAGSASGSLAYSTNSDTARKVVVKMNAVTSGLVVELSATTSGVGTSLHLPGGELELTTADQELINGIVSGSGTASLGYKATATLALKPGNYDKTVTYTLLAP